MKYLIGFVIGVISTLTVIYIKMVKEFDDFWYWGEIWTLAFLLDLVLELL